MVVPMKIFFFIYIDVNVVGDTRRVEELLKRPNVDVGHSPDILSLIYFWF